MAPRRLLARQRGGSTALAFNPTSPVTSRQPLFIPHNDIDDEMDIDCGGGIDSEILGLCFWNSCSHPLF